MSKYTPKHNLETDISQNNYHDNTNSEMLSINPDEPEETGFDVLRDPNLDLIKMKSQSSEGGILGIKKMAKRAKTLGAMSKSLTGGAGDLLGGVKNLSKDAINKL